jgi:hypothetical protein
MPSEFFDEAKILRKYQIQYFRCTACGFLQTETPYWLDEAYSSAIAKQDTGILERNLLNRELTNAVLTLLCPEVKVSVDFGGGHGVFVRLMRDRGFHFVWHDPHAANDYAPGFEYQEGQKCDFLTAFEVLEHLHDPVVSLTRMMSLSPNVFVSTLLLPQPIPKISDWWYYATLSGQHVSFYTLETLQIIAKRFGRQLQSRGSYHLFTTAPKNKGLYRVATSMKASRIVNKICRRGSLSQSDYQLLTKGWPGIDDSKS